MADIPEDVKKLAEKAVATPSSEIPPADGFTSETSRERIVGSAEHVPSLYDEMVKESTKPPTDVEPEPDKDTDIDR